MAAAKWMWFCDLQFCIIIHTQGSTLKTFVGLPLTTRAEN